MAVQWIRRMECAPGLDPLPMRGPFEGKLPTYKRLSRNPLKLAGLPQACDVFLDPNEPDWTATRPYGLGKPPREIYNPEAIQVSRDLSCC
jgi:hypothetical protein